MGLISQIWEFIGYVGTAILAALTFNSEQLTLLAASPQSWTLSAAIAFSGGISMLLGQSVVLFLNRVPPRRFAISLVLNGVIFAIELALWAIVLWLTAWLFFREVPAPAAAIRLIGLSSAPFVFGFLVLIPYLGPVIARLLYVYSLLIAIDVAQGIIGVQFLQALGVVSAGWVLMLVLSNTIGRPIVWLRNWLWRRLVGQPAFRTSHDVFIAFAREVRANNEIEAKRQ
jgi:hypothetical protein